MSAPNEVHLFQWQIKIMANFMRTTPKYLVSHIHDCVVRLDTFLVRNLIFKAVREMTNKECDTGDCPESVLWLWAKRNGQSRLPLKYYTENIPCDEEWSYALNWQIFKRINKNDALWPTSLCADRPGQRWRPPLRELPRYRPLDIAAGCGGPAFRLLNYCRPCKYQISYCMIEPQSSK